MERERKAEAEGEDEVSKRNGDTDTGQAKMKACKILLSPIKLSVQSCRFAEK